MQTIKKVKYSIERVGNSTFCTMSCDLEYIMDYLEGANIKGFKCWYFCIPKNCDF